MWRFVRRAIVAPMATARTSITIVVDLDEATDTPSGSARLPDGTAREFHGWIGLAEAIDALARIPQASHQPEPNEKEEGR